MTLIYELDLDILPLAKIQVCTSVRLTFIARRNPDTHTHTPDVKTITPDTSEKWVVNIADRCTVGCALIYFLLTDKGATRWPNVLV